MPATGVVGQTTFADGTQPTQDRFGRLGDKIFSELNGRYYEQAKRGRLFWAHAIVTAPVIFSTAAGTGGPFLWNGSSNVDAVLLGVGLGVTTVTTVAAALGITGNTGQSVVPTATTTIDSRTAGYIGGAASNCTPYRIATPASAGAFFIPFSNLHTGALTVDNAAMLWVDLGGSIVVPPSCWASVAASATASTTVASISLLWAENPV